MGRGAYLGRMSADRNLNVSHGGFVRRQRLRLVRWLRRHVPPGIRGLVGVLLVIGGIFGALPVLGFWMLPLGLLVIAVDCREVKRAFRRRLEKTFRRGS